MPATAKLAEVPAENFGTVRPDGYLVSNEALERLGDGDLARGRRRLRLLLADEREPRIIRGPTAKPDDVRIATPKDEDALLELAMIDLEENATEIAPISPERVMEHIQIGTRRKGGITACIDGPHKKPVAMLVLHPFQFWFSSAFHVQDVFNFVHPDHRASTHAAHLLDFEKWVSDEWTRGFGYRVHLLTGVTALHRMREKVRLFRRKLTPIGALFLYPYPEGLEP